VPSVPYRSPPFHSLTVAACTSPPLMRYFISVPVSERRITAATGWRLP
jgi:hypothetical protein